MINRYLPFRLSQGEADELEATARAIDVNLSWLVRRYLKAGRSELSLRELKKDAKTDASSQRRNRRA